MTIVDFIIVLLIIVAPFILVTWVLYTIFAYRKIAGFNKELEIEKSKHNVTHSYWFNASACYNSIVERLEQERNLNRLTVKKLNQEIEFLNKQLVARQLVIEYQNKEIEKLK